MKETPSPFRIPASKKSPPPSNRAQPRRCPNDPPFRFHPGLLQSPRPKDPNANGQLIYGKDGVVIGSQLIGQPFSGPGYFHSRPSAAGAAGYDATASGGSNLGPTNAQLIARVNGEVAKLQAENPGTPIPVDLVTTSGSGLDPDISPAAAQFQIRRVASERKIPEAEV